jgi:hypothetical protein
MYRAWDHANIQVNAATRITAVVQTFACACRGIALKRGAGVFGLKRGRGLRGQPLIIHDAGGQAAAAQTMRRAAPSNYISFTSCYNWVKKKTLWSWHHAPRVDLLREEVEVLGYQNYFTEQLGTAITS